MLHAVPSCDGATHAPGWRSVAPGQSFSIVQRVSVPLTMPHGWPPCAAATVWQVGVALKPLHAIPERKSQASELPAHELPAPTLIAQVPALQYR